MHRRNLICAAAWASFLNFTASMLAAPPPPPRYDHVVIVIEENKGYNTIIGSSSAPYINKLAAEGTNFTNFYAFKHTSAPNYGELFAGASNNLPDNGIAPGVPLTTPNLGAEIRQAEFSFGGYSQSLPSIGFTGEFSGDYARRHNPWVNWQNDTAPVHPNQLPSAVNMPFTMFPTNFDLLPTVSFVVPDNAHNMHDSGAVPISTDTFNGDLNLDGGIDADDYALIDSGYAQKLTGWANGDLDYSGTINADDFFLIDLAFANQSSLPAPLPLAPMNVPEPTFAAWIAALGILGLLRPRSWRRLPERRSRSRRWEELIPASAAAETESLSARPSAAASCPRCLTARDGN